MATSCAHWAGYGRRHCDSYGIDAREAPLTMGVMTPILPSMPRDLKKEISQNKPFRSLTQEAQLNVVRTSAVLIDRFEQMLKPAGITGAQYNVLRILQGSSESGLCRNEIRDRMITRMPDMTRMLDRMEEAGLITRERQGDDRRMVNTQLSAKGRRILQKLDAAVQEEHEKRFAHLSEAQLRSLVSMLTSVRNTE